MVIPLLLSMLLVRSISSAAARAAHLYVQHNSFSIHYSLDVILYKRFLQARAIDEKPTGTLFIMPKLQLINFNRSLRVPLFKRLASNNQIILTHPILVGK